MTLARRNSSARPARPANRWLQWTGALCATAALLGAAHAQDASSLHAKFDSLQDKLEHNDYGRPLVLQSTQTSDRLEGEVYARGVLKHTKCEHEDLDLGTIRWHLVVHNIQGSAYTLSGSGTAAQFD